MDVEKWNICSTKDYAANLPTCFVLQLCPRAFLRGQVDHASIWYLYICTSKDGIFILSPLINN